LSDQAISAILSQPDSTNKIGVRDSTLLVLLYDSGVRLAELLNLRIGNVNIDSNNSHIRVLGKGSKERVVSISENTVEHISNYLNLFRNKDDYDTDLLFYTVIKGKADKMSERNVERLMQQYADKAREHCSDIPQKVHPHMFRRARATRMYQNGVALPLVSRFLGHSDLSTTKIYATPSMEMMKDVVTSTSFPFSTTEKPIWDNEDDIAKKCGIR
jgi:site-specific recombinase XerD